MDKCLFRLDYKMNYPWIFFFGLMAAQLKVNSFSA